MKFIYSVLALSALISSVSAAPVPFRKSIAKRDVDPSLIPQFGHAAGLNPTGTGDCDGVPNAAGVIIKVPCSCPPDRNLFIQALNANVAAGHAVNNTGIAVSFPTDQSQASQLARINTAPAPAPTSGGVDPALVPQFGHAAGLDPTGTGNCAGVTNSAGVVIEVPCSCPPDRDSFIQSLNANVNAGHAVNNPSISVSFPTDSSKASQLARINTAIVTLQNLRGPGVGCPAASTTFVAQQAAIESS